MRPTFDIIAAPPWCSESKVGLSTRTSALDSCKSSVASGTRLAENSSYRSASNAVRILSLSFGSSRQSRTRRRCHLSSSTLAAGLGRGAGLLLLPDSRLAIDFNSSACGWLPSPPSSGVVTGDCACGKTGSSTFGGATVTVCRHRGHITVNDSVGSLLVSKANAIEHCGQLVVMRQTPSDFRQTYSSSLPERRLAPYCGSEFLQKLLRPVMP